MNLLNLIILVLIEGVADVLPIDGSGHAALAAKLLGWRAGSIDIALQFGAAVALLLFLWRDIARIGIGLWRLRKQKIEDGTRLLIKVVIAAVPWIAITKICHGLTLCLPEIGGITILCALLMLCTDRLCMTLKRIEHLDILGSLVIGLASLLAIVPGVGRTAAAYSASRLLGLERPAAFRFVLLVQIPILMAQSLESVITYSLQDIISEPVDLIAASLSMIGVLIAAGLATGWIRRFGLTPFAIYRVILGVIMIAVGISF